MLKECKVDDLSVVAVVSEIFSLKLKKYCFIITKTYFF
jgi:hypothetical protein